MHSQELINVSKDWSSDPIPESSSPRSAPPIATVGSGAEDRVEESITDDFLHGTETQLATPSATGEALVGNLARASRRINSTQAAGVVESNTDLSSALDSHNSQPHAVSSAHAAANPIDGPTQENTTRASTAALVQASNDNTRLKSDTQALGAHLYSRATAKTAVLPTTEVHSRNEEDLYGATPERKTQKLSQRFGERPVATTIYLAVASLFPTVDASERKPSASLPAPLETATRSALQESESTASEKRMAGIATPQARAMSTVSSTAPSTGKLRGGGTAAILRARRGDVLGHPENKSTKSLATAITKQEPPAKPAANLTRETPLPSGRISRAFKPKETVEDGPPEVNFGSGTVLSRAGAHGKANGKANGRILPEKPTKTATAARKRKVETDAAGTKGNEARLSKRAKGASSNEPASPIESRPPIVTSGSFRPDSTFDFPESPGNAGPSKTAKKSAGRSTTAASRRASASETIQAASNKAARQNGTRTRLQALGEQDGEKRQLRPRKPMHHLHIETEGDEQGQSEVAQHSPHTTGGGAGVSHATSSAERVQNAVQIDEQSPEQADKEVKHAVTVDTKAVPRPSASPVRARPGGSQCNAIVLSDHSELSSSIEQDTPEPEKLPAQSKRAADLETPAAIRSSPPRAFSRAGSQSLCGTGRSRKTQIISFDKTGPRNQGSVPKSWNTRASLPPMNVAVNWGSSAANTTGVARNKASSVATSVRSGRSNAAAPASNVATDVCDALAGLPKRRPPTASPAMITVNTVQIRPDHSIDRLVDLDNMVRVGEDSGFTTMNDMERFVNSPSPGQQLNSELKHIPTASQVIMPPPKHKPRSPRRSAESLSNSGMQAAQPLPSGPAADSANTNVFTQKQKSSGALQGLSHAQAALHGSSVSSNSKGKRPILADRSSENPPKRGKGLSLEDKFAEAHSKNDTDYLAARSVEESKATSPRASSAKHRLSINLAQPVERPIKRAKATGSKQAHAEPLQQLKPGTTQQLPSKINVPLVAQPEHLKHATLNQARHTSRNSQTVDINGSPVPPDMDLTESSTVLETFSQQADHSSGTAQQLTTRLKTPRDIGAAITDDAFSVPPSHQPLSMSSNTKALPGPSGSSSKTIRRVKLTQAEQDDITNTNKSSIATSDPFASTGESRINVVEVKNKEHLLERTLNFAHYVGARDQPSATNRTNVKDMNTTVEKDPITVPKPAESSPAPEMTNNFASKLDLQVAALREHTAFTRAPENDPDQTLVNDCSQGTTLSKSVASTFQADDTAISSPLSVNEPAMSVESSEAEDGDDDLRSWRRSLRPHQLGLYEELVKIARVVTGYVAAMETSADVMIDENYRRELILIEQEEEIRKKQYKQYQVKMQQQKKEKIREMQSLERVLQGVLDASAASWEEHCRGRAEKERINREYDTLVNSLS